MTPSAALVAVFREGSSEMTTTPIEEEAIHGRH